MREGEREGCRPTLGAALEWERAQERDGKPGLGGEAPVARRPRTEQEGKGDDFPKS